MSIAKNQIRLFILIIVACVIYACASISREIAAPAAESSSKPVTPDKPAAVDSPEAVRQKQKRQRSEKEGVQERPLEQKKAGKYDGYLNKTEERAAPAAAPLMKESVVPKREMLEEGGIGGTGNTDCADGKVKPGCSKTE